MCVFKNFGPIKINGCRSRNTRPGLMICERGWKVIFLEYSWRKQRVSCQATSNRVFPPNCWNRAKRVNNRFHSRTIIRFFLSSPGRGSREWNFHEGTRTLKERKKKKKKNTSRRGQPSPSARHHHSPTSRPRKKKDGQDKRTRKKAEESAHRSSKDPR